MARCLAGAARRDITPPIGIYNRSWGAALADTAAGVHRPFTATALALGNVRQPLETPHILLALDLGWLEPEENQELMKKLLTASGLPESHLLVSLSHTHSGPNLTMKLADRAGGHLLRPFFDRLISACAEAVSEARAGMRPAWVTLGNGRCDLASNRDAWDKGSDQYVCGYNPAGKADETVVVARVTGDRGDGIATLLNYGCHPTTLGPENRLLSPDYVGAARAVLESQFGCLSLFVLGACGDTAPREGYVADAKVADRNGRQLGFAAASALESLPPPGQELAYDGPLVSGATLGVWSHRPIPQPALEEAMVLRSARIPLELPLKPKESLESLRARYDEADREVQKASAAGDTSALRHATAMRERARRTLHRAPLLPDNGILPFSLWVWQVGHAFLVAIPAEPYSWLQTELRRRFPGRAILVSVVTNGAEAYLLPKNLYGIGLYQDWVSPAGPGGLELLAEAAARQIEAWLA